MVNRRQEALEAWAKEAFVSDTMEGTFQKNAAALGGLKVLDEIISLEYEDVVSGGEG